MAEVFIAEPMKVLRQSDARFMLTIASTELLLYFRNGLNSSLSSTNLVPRTGFMSENYIPSSSSPFWEALSDDVDEHVRELSSAGSGELRRPYNPGQLLGVLARDTKSEDKYEVQPFQLFQFGMIETDTTRLDLGAATSSGKRLMFSRSLLSSRRLSSKKHNRLRLVEFLNSGMDRD